MTPRQTNAEGKPDPRVGEIVLYRGEKGRPSEPVKQSGYPEHPAIITGVNTDGSVNLTVFFDNAAPEPRTSLDPARGYWVYPPQD